MRRLLVVDDDDAIREVLEIALGIVGGFQVRTASSGAECLELARSVQLDAILLDVMMPSMDGFATLQHLRRDPLTDEIPVILMTAKTQTHDRWNREHIDPSGVITKPFDPMTLHAQVKSLLGWT